MCPSLPPLTLTLLLRVWSKYLALCQRTFQSFNVISFQNLQVDSVLGEFRSRESRRTVSLLMTQPTMTRDASSDQEIQSPTAWISQHLAD